MAERSEAEDGDKSADTPAVHILMAGGGTGGHVFPALAVAAQLEKRGHRVSWAGRAGSMEEALVREAALPFHALDARPWVGKGLAGKVSAALTLVRSSLRGRALVQRVDPDAVLGTGGYVSVPAVLGARLARTPSFLLEPNAHAGSANRLAARWASGSFVAYESVSRQLACAVEVTGIPVRSSFHCVGPLPAGDPHVLILGGSQGALQLNELLPGLVSGLRSRPGLTNLTVTHQTGAAHIASVETAYGELGVETGRSVAVVPFIDDVAAAMARAHLVISRAGALATAELAAAGRPSVLVPLLAAGGGHQRFNAERMEAAGAALALTEEDLDAARLGDEIAALLTDRSRLEAMSSSARALGNPEAAKRIADALIQAGGEG